MRFKHYRGGEYQLEHLAKSVDQKSVVVVYRSIQEGFVYTRPVEEFFGKVDHNTNRFELMGSEYDSTADTLEHIYEVRKALRDVTDNLSERGRVHDESKLFTPEKEAFDEYTPKLRDTTYGSEEYKENLKGLGVALEHHYSNNSHHPEHYEEGVYGMCLLDIVEMLADWYAATKRHNDGDLGASIQKNQDRFGYDDNMRNILTNTARKLGWLDTKEEG